MTSRSRGPTPGPSSNPRTGVNASMHAPHHANVHHTNANPANVHDHPADALADASTHEQEHTPTPDQGMPPLVLGQGTQGSPILTHTPRPAEGWAMPRLRSAWGPLLNLRADQVREWEVVDPMTAVIMFIYDLGVMDARLTFSKSKEIRSVIGQYLGITPDDVGVSPPQPASTTPQFLALGPFGILGWGLQPAQTQRLLDMQVLCTTTLTIIFQPLSPHLPLESYLLSLVDFSTDNSQHLRSVVISILQRDEVRQEVLRYAAQDPYYATINTQILVDTFLHSIRIDIIPTRGPGGTERPTANVYGKLPTYNPSHRDALVKVFSKQSYRHSFFGHGTFRAPFHCTRCHGADHPSGLCPLPLTPGWLGPPPEESNAPPVPAPTAASRVGDFLLAPENAIAEILEGPDRAPKQTKSHHATPGNNKNPRRNDRGGRANRRGRGRA
ncbi:hypothetical protein NEOLEDRAFT_238884 [Neolentinus lepideus HHB14362 ss-1]|uniref:Uncharacterized protein n=1 Tax=Neolentinus lepideus HHB14362 ss-1 TaxID=1314782 RepID=A0A165T665_9AGAM|nr:hypothetical protein NEOLEDRAFT_238884 [Neolentinus lepideus HHB14362 ss-1]